VLVDALRADHVSFNGYERKTTPFLDALAERGTVFERAYAHAPGTLLSTAILLTGRYFPLLIENDKFEEIPGMPAGRQAWLASIPSLARENLTLSERLERLGYETLMIATNPHHHKTSGFSQGFDRYIYLHNEGSTSLPYADGEAVNQSFVSWLEERSADAPFFAYLHYMDVHSPYDPPPAYRDRFVTRQGRYFYTNGKPDPTNTPNEDDLRYMQALYDAGVLYVDTLLSELYEALVRTGIHENTVFVVTADHGDEFMEHGGLGHGKTLEMEMLRVPLLISFPPLTDARPRVQEIVGLIDLAPTLLARAGYSPDSLLEGRNLIEFMGSGRGGPREPDRLYAYLDERMSAAALVSSEWYFILETAGGKAKLYPNRAQPRGYATEDIASGEPPGQIQSFREEVIAFVRSADAAREHVRAMGDEVAESGELVDQQRMDGKILDQLRALGYLR